MIEIFRRHVYMAEPRLIYYHILWRSCQSIQNWINTRKDHVSKRMPLLKMGLRGLLLQKIGQVFMGCPFFPKWRQPTARTNIIAVTYRLFPKRSFWSVNIFVSSGVKHFDIRLRPFSKRLERFQFAAFQLFGHRGLSWKSLLTSRSHSFPCSAWERFSDALPPGPESSALFQAMIMLLELLITVSMEKKTRRNNRNSSIPSSKFCLPYKNYFCPGFTESLFVTFQLF